MNHAQYKQLVQNIKTQHAQYVNRIKMLETELNKFKDGAAQNNLENIQLKEMFNSEVEKRTQQLDFSNNKINELSSELAAKKVELDAKTAELSAELDAKTVELDAKTAELDAKTAELDSKTAELSAELDAKTAELEYSKKKINEILGDLDKKKDAFHNIDKIIFRNNEYFDEIKKELNDKIAHNKEVNELYEKKNHELNAIQTELESAYKELEITKTELQLYKNDFILKSATF
jgi:chromosome segregation ATPase